jgi:hypothetical protein
MLQLGFRESIFQITQIAVKVLVKMTEINKREVSNLGDVVQSIFTGINPQRHQPFSGQTSSLCLINVKDIQDGSVAEVQALQTIELPANSQTDRFKVQVGDVLVTGRGNPRVASVREKHVGCLAGPNIIVIRPASMLDASLVVAFLQHAQTRATLARKSVGTTVPTLTVKAISELDLAIPTAEEQQRLSRLVDLAEQQLRSARRAAELRRDLAQELVMRTMTP